MPINKILTNDSNIKIKEVISGKKIILECEDEKEHFCPYCGSFDLRCKDSYIRNIKNINIGLNSTILCYKAHKYVCNDCGQYFSKKQRYATTFVNLSKHRVFDVALGRSE